MAVTQYQLAAFFVIGFIALDLWLLFRVWRKVRNQRARAFGRERWLSMASRAANDPTLKALLALLAASESATDENPVRIDWLLRHQGSNGDPQLLLKISWDGNEWRRLVRPAEAHELLKRALKNQPALQSRSAENLIELLEPLANPR